LTARLAALGTPAIVGIIGAASAGKTTLAKALVRGLQALGIDAVHVDGDAFTLPRHLRYIQHPGRRQTLIRGPDIYDHQRLLDHLLTLKQSHDVVIAESVAMGWHPATASALACLIGLHLDDAVRLSRKIVRDQHDPTRQFDLVADFIEKQVDEVDGGVHPTFARRADVVWDASAHVLHERK